MIFQVFKSSIRASLLLVLLLRANFGYGNQAEITIAGASSASGTLKMLAAEFMKSHPGIRVQISSNIENNGTINAVLAGAVDIGLMSRPLRDDESGLGLTSIEYARTPLAFIAGSDADVTDLTINDVIKIYRGETTTWHNGKRIRLILYSASDNDTVLLKRVSQEMSEAVDMAMARHGMMIALSNRDGYDKVKKIPGAFGFCSLTRVLAEDGSVKIISLNGVYPTIANLKSGSYPFFKPMNMIFKKNTSHAVAEFVKFIDSPVAATIIEKTGGVPVSAYRHVPK